MKRPELHEPTGWLSQDTVQGVRTGLRRCSFRPDMWSVNECVQGVRRPPLPDRLVVKRALAAHEAGKGLVATLLRQRTGFLERIERVSMVPRGR